MIESLIQEMNAFHFVGFLAVALAFFGALGLTIYCAVLVALSKQFDKPCDCEDKKPEFAVDAQVELRRAEREYMKQFGDGRISNDPDATADVRDVCEEAINHIDRKASIKNYRQMKPRRE